MLRLGGEIKRGGQHLGNTCWLKPKTIFPLDEFTNQGYEVTKQMLKEC